MKTSLLLVGIAILAALVSGCHHQAAQPPASEKVIALENVDWQLATLGGKAPVKLGEDKPVSLRFDAKEKRASGYSGVNQFSGSYTLDGQKLTFGPTMMTRRAGPPELMQQESAFTEALAKTAGWRAAGDGIDLLDASNHVLATFTAAAKGAAQ